MVVKVGTHFTLRFIDLAVIIITVSFFIRTIAKTILKVSVILSEEGEFESQKKEKLILFHATVNRSLYTLWCRVTHLMAPNVCTIN